MSYNSKVKIVMDFSRVRIMIHEVVYKLSDLQQIASLPKVRLRIPSVTHAPKTFLGTLILPGEYYTSF